MANIKKFKNEKVFPLRMEKEDFDFYKDESEKENVSINDILNRVVKEYREKNDKNLKKENGGK